MQEQTLNSRGEAHLEYFQDLAEKVGGHFFVDGKRLTAEAKRLDSEQTRQKIKRELLASGIDLGQLAQEAIKLFDSLKSKEVSGHEKSHVVDNLLSAYRIFQEYEVSGKKLEDFEKLEILMAILGHDLGRGNSDILGKAVVKGGNEKKLDEKQIEFLAPAILGKSLIRKLPKELQERILLSIATGFVANTGIRTSDAVHQADREQLVGSATIPRGLAFDVGIGPVHRDLAMSENEEFKTKLPLPGSGKDTNLLVQYEFYMRNLFSPSSPNGQQVYNEIKKQNAVVLMLALDGEDPELYDQVFGLEEREYESAHWSKKPMDPGVYEDAKKGKDDFLSKKADIASYNPGSEADLAIKIMKAEGIVMPQTMRDVLQKKLADLTEGQKKNFWTILRYTVEKRKEKIAADLEMIKNSKTGVEHIMAQYCESDLKERQNKYHSL